MTVAASAQATGAASAPGSRAGSKTTPSALPPGATSTRGDKAAVPASGASAAIDPNTGSTPGMPPGAGSARGDKAMTPKGKGDAAPAGSAASR
jgi:hypothetical protein